MLAVLVVAFGLLTHAICGDVSLGGNCSIANDYVDSASRVFKSDCNAQTYCTTNGRCAARRCRRDQWPYGYTFGAALPPLCPEELFCPDEGSGCLPLIPIGQACQLERDDECAPPPPPLPAKLSMCLQSVCQFSNAAANQACILDSTIYTVKDSDGIPLSTTINRDNCIKPSTYCDADVRICVPASPVGGHCKEDRMCISDNCGSNNICLAPPELPLQIPGWQYVITGFAVILGTITAFIILVYIHQRHRKERLREIEEYYREQTCYRDSIISLQLAAIERARVCKD